MRCAASDIGPFAGDPSWKVGIVHSSFYGAEIAAMVGRACEELEHAGIPQEHITVRAAPGSFEIPLVGEALAASGAVDALIGLGIIVEGETQHARLVAQETARGIMDVQLRHRMPFGFGVLYVPDLALARARLDRGAETARAVLAALAALRAP